MRIFQVDLEMISSIKIFAKKSTKEKIIIQCPITNVGLVMTSLEAQYGGTWVLVDELKIKEILKFSDELEYNGYNPRIKRYSSNIDTLIL
jgi:hypothetical protein